jgi:thiamine kinase-like enzyme
MENLSAQIPWVSDNAVLSSKCDANLLRWHADIKPNNILLVNGRFKLADFGYSAFTPVAKTKSGMVPTDYIHGFTDSYGII